MSLSKYFLIVLLLFCFLNIFLINCQSLKPDEYVCLNNIVLAFNISSFKLLPSGTYDFCGGPGMICDATSGSVTSLSIGTKNDIFTSGKVLTSDHLTCLPNFTTLKLNFITITSEFIYFKFPKCTSVSYLSVIGITGITKPIPDYEYFEIDALGMEGQTINLSNLIAVKDIVVKGSTVNLIGDSIPIGTRINTFRFTIEVLNFPSLIEYSNITIVIFIIDNDKFDFESSMKNFATISNPSFSAFHFSGQPIQFYLGLNYKIKITTITGRFSKPPGDKVIDLTGNTNYDFILVSNLDLLFNVGPNAEIPIIVDKFTNINYQNGYISRLPSLSDYGNSQSETSLISSLISSELPIFNGTGRKYIFDTNSITGTIDKSWCSTMLSIKNNLMTGQIPSCYVCYFKYLAIFDGLVGNQFSNYDINTPCTTFAPKIQILNENTINIYGQDIGFDQYNFRVNGSIGLTNLVHGIRTNGKEYTGILENGLTFQNVDYFSIRFLLPHNSSITFPTVEKVSSPSIIRITGDKIEIDGTHFSSYLGYFPQTVEIGGKVCEISQCDFFTIVCNLPTGTTFADDIQILKITTNNTFIKIVEFNVRNSMCMVDNFDKCESFQHVVTSVTTTTTEGGVTTFVGAFGIAHSNLLISIGGVDCPVIESSVTSNQIQCNAAKDKGVQKYILSQNGFTVSGEYQYTETVQPCPEDCSGNGVCNTATGECRCATGYSSYDCSVKDGTKPPTNTTIDPINGGTNSNIQEINFSIYFKSLSEIDINGNPIETHSLQKNWILNSTNIENQHTFKQTIKTGTCSIVSTIEEVKDEQGKQFEFAGTTFKLDQGSIKFTISISNYTFKNNLNTLRLDLISIVNENEESECNSKDTEIDTINQSTTFNYIRISKNNKILSGRFINKLISDGKSTYLGTTISKEEESIIVSLNLPHCSECLLDPDFSVLVSPDFKSECNSSSRKWVIPVAVVVSVVGVATVVSLSYLVYKRKVEGKFLKKLGMMKLNKFASKK